LGFEKISVSYSKKIDRILPPPGELINKLEVEFKRDERVMRFLTVSLDKHAIAYNEKKRSGAFNKKPKTEEAAA
jgi:small subunit ribosomal protein S6